MKTAKKLGFKKGDLVFTGMFPAVLCQDAHLTTPMVEAFGMAVEMGSCYAENLSHLSDEEFARLVKAQGLKGNEGYSEMSKTAYPRLTAKGRLQWAACRVVERELIQQYMVIRLQTREYSLPG